VGHFARIAYNVSTDLSYFDLIVPCGIAGKRATSLEKLLGRRVEIHDAAPRISAHLADIFGLAPRACGQDEMDACSAVCGTDGFDNGLARAGFVNLRSQERAVARSSERAFVDGPLKIPASEEAGYRWQKYFGLDHLKK